MAAADTALAGVTTEHGTRVIDACVLIPIPGLRPAGEDIRGLKLWVDLRAARPKPFDAAGDNAWQRADAVVTDWVSYGEMVEHALCTRSKDLELALSLTEARTRTRGFAGARDGLWMVRGLIEGFADEGLYPLADDGDMETQYGPLYWLNEKFSEVLHEVELTLTSEGTNYSLNYRIEAFNPRGGMITVAQWDAAAMGGSVAAYRELLGTIEAAQTELKSLKDAVSQRYGAVTLSFSVTDETLDSCRSVVQGFLRKLAGKEKGEPRPEDPVVLPGPMRDIPAYEPANAPPGTTAWVECERLARSGQVDQALREMTSLAAAEPNGRIRFQRKLLLADLCLQTNRKQLGASILQELNEIIEQHKLETWETSEIVGGVWARLVRCYRDKAAGTADEAREGEFYGKLSRLDPWQALATGEPARRE